MINKAKLTLIAAYSRRRASRCLRPHWRRAPTRQARRRAELPQVTRPAIMESGLYAYAPGHFAASSPQGG